MDIFQGRMDLAVEYGADVSIFIHNVVFWVEKNAANRVNYFDGRYWTYNSMRALCELYPLWSRDQIKRIIKKCEDNGLLLIGNYNKKPMDRTQWYTPSDKILALYGMDFSALPIGRNRHMEGAESPNASGESATAIPSIDQVDSQDTPYNPPKGDVKAGKKKKSRYELAEDAKPVLRQYCGTDRELASALARFIEMRTQLRAINSKDGIVMLLNKLDTLSGGSREMKLLLIQEAMANSWKSVFPLKGSHRARGAPDRIQEEEGTYAL